MKKLNPQDINRLALAKKCVSCPYARITRMPAAFLQNMQFSIVMRYINSGVYEYKPSKKSKAPWPKTLYRIFDRNGNEMPRHPSGRCRTREEAIKMTDHLNKTGEFPQYSIIPE